MSDNAVGRRPKNADTTREKILVAAGRCFARRGYPYVTLGEIASAAGVTAALVNRYFGSKQHLFEMVVRRREGWNVPAEVAESNDPAVIAGTIVDLWRDIDAGAPGLALVRSVDLDKGALLREELTDRLHARWRPVVPEGPDAEARVRIMVGIVMGVGLFGMEALLGDDIDTLDDELAARLERRLAPVIAAALYE